MFKEVWININKAIAELMGLDYYSEEEYESSEPEDYSEEEPECYDDFP